MRAISREDSREVDRRASAELAIPSLALMENAGNGAARLALELAAGRPGPVVCVCGPGNNGGDGLVVARHAAIAGHEAVVILLPSRSGSGPGGDAGMQLAIIRAIELELLTARGPGELARAREILEAAAVTVDGLFGTGLDRALEGVAAALVEAINACGAPVLSLDLPSGLDCDTGAPLGRCVRAVATATFVAPKLGFGSPGAARWTGDVHVVGIGAPREWPPPAERA